jgi:hypothetical protein
MTINLISFLSLTEIAVWEINAAKCSNSFVNICALNGNFSVLKLKIRRNDGFFSLKSDRECGEYGKN